MQTQGRSVRGTRVDVLRVPKREFPTKLISPIILERNSANQRDAINGIYIAFTNSTVGTYMCL